MNLYCQMKYNRFILRCEFYDHYRGAVFTQATLKHLFMELLVIHTGKRRLSVNIGPERSEVKVTVRATSADSDT